MTLKHTFDQLKTIPKGTTVYDIYAIDTPGCPETKIGHFETVTDFITSRWADESLFFQHNRRESDFEGSHADWAKYSDQADWGFFSGLTIERADKPPKCPFAALFK